MRLNPLTAVAVILLSGGAAALAAQTPPRSAPIADVRYEVTFNAQTAANNELTVRMTFRAAGREPVLLSFPAWTPGAYEISNFARKVTGFEATAGDQALDWDKLDHDTWRVQPTAAQTVTVAFTAQADSLDNAMSWSRPDFLLFNGTNVFPYPEGRPLEFAARVAVRTEADWSVATGMTPAGAAREYTAGNFHDLVDMPFFVGRLDVDSAQIEGKWHRLATYPRGIFAGAARRGFWDQLRAMTPAMSRVFGETPWDSYTTMIIFEASFPGASALEHQNSHVGIYTPAIIGSPFLPSITAHEIFHAWNVKRLRPAELWPYDYDQPQPTTLLWVSEGITDYYADLALVRGDIIPTDLFIEITQRKIEDVANNPPVALEDASLSTWIDPVDGSRYVYYPKGSLAGLLLDIMIRDASDNRASLDLVLRDLYTTAYKAGRGFTVEQFWQAVSRAAGGKSFAEFAERHIDGRDPLPYAQVFPLGGFAFRADSARVPRLGVNTGLDSTGVVVTAVTPGSSAEDAGVQPGDRLIRVGDVEVVGQEFGDEFRARYQTVVEGSPLTITVRRGGRTLTLTGRLRFVPVVTYALEAEPDPSAKAARIRDGILKGTP